MMRQRLGLLVLPLLLISVLGFSQCKVTLNWWHEFGSGGEKDGMDLLISTWNKANPDIQITQRPIGNEEFFTVIRTGLAGDQPPDLLQYEGNQQTRDFAKAGQLQDITDIWNQVKDNYTLFRDNVISGISYEGKVYALPYSWHGGFQIYYNKDMLAAMKMPVPKTFEEFLADCEKFKQKGIAPISLGAKNGWPAMQWWQIFLAQRVGAKRVNDALWLRNGVKWTDPDFVQAASEFVSLKTKGYFSEGFASDDYGTAQSAFYASKSPFFETGTWLINDAADNPPPFNFGFFPVPRYSNAKVKTDSVGALLTTFGVPSRGQHVPEALKVTKWLSGPQANGIWARRAGVIVLYKGLMEKFAPGYLNEIFAAVYKDVKGGTVPWLENESPPAVGEDLIYNGTVAMLTGDLTVNQFLTNLQAGYEKYR